MKKAKVRSTAGAALRSPKSASVAAASSTKKARKSNLAGPNRDLQMSPYNQTSVSKAGRSSSGNKSPTKNQISAGEAFAAQAELITTENLRVAQ